uniref:Uncharacterized protein n=1 Tax=Romanomermis culicivorax TaxID=13658 RepID=A0A915IUA6_ROMCU
MFIRDHLNYKIGCNSENDNPKKENVNLWCVVIITTVFLKNFFHRNAGNATKVTDFANVRIQKV